MLTNRRRAASRVSIACLFVLTACGGDNDTTQTGAGSSGGTAGGSAGSGGNGSMATASAQLAELTVGSDKSGVSGEATFTAKSNGVELHIMLMGCTSGEAYPVHIHSGTSCESTETQMGHWDVPRGEGIDNIPCTDGKGALMYERTDSEADKAWTIGGGGHDIVGHVLVVHNANGDRVACGKITQ